jgi:hypothetical protein
VIIRFIVCVWLKCHFLISSLHTKSRTETIVL